mgnify:CR=1 FL=1
MTSVLSGIFEGNFLGGAGGSASKQDGVPQVQTMASRDFGDAVAKNNRAADSNNEDSVTRINNVADSMEQP